MVSVTMPLTSLAEPDREAIHPEKGNNSDEKDAQHYTDYDASANIGVLCAIFGELTRDEILSSAWQMWI